MQRFSPERGVNLLSVDECAALFGVSLKTVKRHLKAFGVYVEYHQVERQSGRGSSKTAFIDPLTLGVALKKDVPPYFYRGTENVPPLITEGQIVEKQSGTLKTTSQEPGDTGAEKFTEGHDSAAVLSLRNSVNENPEQKMRAIEPTFKVSEGARIIPNLAEVKEEYLTLAQRRAKVLLPLKELPKKARLERFAALAESGELGVSTVRSVRRLYNQAVKGRKVKGQARSGALALVRTKRADKGKPRIPEELRDLLATLWMMHPNASAAKLLNIIELNEPALLTYQKQKTHKLSESTVQRVRRWMKRVPEFKYALMNADAQHEFNRVWAGEVLTDHACQLWMADMTRCDTFVFDPNDPEPTMYRLRVHAIIDVYSGAVPAFVFSRDEDQSATDRMLFLAVHEKPDVWAERWPIYGRPETLYWDNGKVYRSKKSEQICSNLGIRLTHSRPYVSHSRGNIERLFGVFHQGHEKYLPGYAGTDVVEKSGKELQRLWKNTLRWLEQGGPDPYPERLLSEDEYKRKALNWLVVEYHQKRHLGRTYTEHYLETVPVTARATLSFDELMALFSNREIRTVEGNGFIRWRNQRWGLEDASLVRHQKEKVVLLINELIPGNEQVKVAVEMGDGNLAVLGDLVPYGGSALDEKNLSYKKAAKAAIKDLAERADEIKGALLDPEWRHDRVHEKAFAELPPITIEPAPRAKLAALNPEEKRAKQLEDDLKALEAEGLKLDWDVEIPSERRRN